MQDDLIHKINIIAFCQYLLFIHLSSDINITELNIIINIHKTRIQVASFILQPEFLSLEC